MSSFCKQKAKVHYVPNIMRHWIGEWIVWDLTSSQHYLMVF